MTDEQFEEFVHSAVNELQAKQDSLSAEYGLGSFARFWLDQTTETLEFFDEEDCKVLEAGIISVGSYASNSNTWKWAWANESVPASLREKAASLKAIADLTGVALFSDEDTIAIEDEHMAWELAAISARHLGAMGIYRTPSSNKPLASFLAIMSVRRVREP